MTITKINLSIKQSVLLRLIKNGESLEDASSKAGLCINLAKDYLKPKSDDDIIKVLKTWKHLIYLKCQLIII